MALLNVHYAAGILLFVIALVAIVHPLGRRIVQYVLAVQVVLGIATWMTTKLAPPAPHWILAVLTGAVWPMANAFERRGRPKAVVAAVCAIGALLIAIVIFIGMHALRQ